MEQKPWKFVSFCGQMDRPIALSNSDESVYYTASNIDVESFFVVYYVYGPNLDMTQGICHPPDKLVFVSV